MIVTTGDRVKRVSSPKIYRVSKITNEWIVLEEEGRFSQVLAGRYNFGLSYKKVRQDRPDEGSNFTMFGSYLG